MVRPFESYLSWCEVQAYWNATSLFMIILSLTVIIVIIVCQTYIQIKAGTSLSCITIKHTFTALLLMFLTSTVIYLVINYELNVFNVLPLIGCIVGGLPLCMNIGFLIKEHTETFPLVHDLFTHPCSVILPEPQEMQMYPVFE